MNSLFAKQNFSNQRVIVVDDVADNCFLLQAILEPEGYEIEIANNGYIALAKIESAPPNLVILDLMMPGMDGLEVAQQIRQNPQLPYIPILLITAYDDLSIPQEHQDKVNGFIRKPFDFEDLLAQVETLLHSPQRLMSV